MNELEQLQKKYDALLLENQELKCGLEAVVELIENSDGVYGLHSNWDLLPWGELKEGGCFEEWLTDFCMTLDKI